MTDAEEQLRQQTRAALKSAGISQAAACRRLGVSTRHLSHMLTGRAPLTLDWTDRILTLCGQRLLVAAVAETASPAVPRQSLDDLTSDQLDQLYDRLDAAERRVQDWKQAAGAGMTNTDRLRAERDALAAGVPLVCSDERHKTKVFALEAEVARLTQAVTDADQDAAEAREHNEQTCEAVAERDRLRATIDRVRTLTDRYQIWHEGGWAPSSAADVAREYRAALDQPQEPTL